MSTPVAVVAALIRRGDTFMICQRPAHKARALLWEFVGGKVEPGETPQQALARECREELAVEIAVGGVFSQVVHAYDDMTVDLTLFNAEITAGTPRLLEHRDVRWITAAEIENYDFCPADEEILNQIRAQDEAVAYARARLFAAGEETLRAFNARLTPTVDPAAIIGVRTPALRKIAADMVRTGRDGAFLTRLPHAYHEENMLHGILISGEKTFSRAVSLLDAFLPYVDNWMVCDTISPKAFRKPEPLLPEQIRRWLADGKTYTVRFAVGCLMRYYLDDNFQPAYLDAVAAIQSDEYYVNMMRAWYFATALAKQYDSAVRLFETRALDAWTHNKTIQKAAESDRMTGEQKAYLKTLKRKAQTDGRAS